MRFTIKNGLTGVIVIGAGFVAVVGFSVFASRYFPAVASNASLLDAWRCIIATIAIVLTKVLYVSMPRIRIMSLQNRAGSIADSGSAPSAQLQMTTPLWWRS